MLRLAAFAVGHTEPYKLQFSFSVSLRCGPHSHLSSPPSCSWDFDTITARNSLLFCATFGPICVSMTDSPTLVSTTFFYQIMNILYIFIIVAFGQTLHLEVVFSYYTPSKYNLAGL